MAFHYWQITVSFIDSIFLFLILLKIIKEYRKNKIENVSNLALFIFFYLLFFASLIVGFIFFYRNDMIMGKLWHNVFSIFFLFGGAGFLLKIPASVYLPKIKGLLPYLTFGYGLAAALISFFNPHLPQFKNEVVLNNLPDWIIYNNIIFSLIIALTAGFFFVNGALAVKNKYLRRRYLILALASFLLGISALFWIPDPVFIKIFSIISIFAYGLAALGVYYQPKDI